MIAPAKHTPAPLVADRTKDPAVHHYEESQHNATAPLDNVREVIGKHPVASVVSAVAVGLAAAWLIKWRN